MRTTINLDEDAAEVAKRYAEDRSLTLGKAISELLRRAASAPLHTKKENGLHVVVLPSGTPRISAEHVRNLRDELE